MDRGAPRNAMTASTAVFVFWLVILMDRLEIVPGKLKLRYEQYDPLFVARCEAQCWLRNTRNACVKQCLTKDTHKPGTCPEGQDVLSSFDTVCLNTCKYDTQCPNVSKCCRHNCGVTCQQPQGLEHAKGLPYIPQNIRITERRKKRTIYIEWKPGESFVEDQGGTTLYLIEERHHCGKYYSERRMTDWAPCARTTKPSHLLRNFIKPGRWYQFRVAAVNENGTRGFSSSSVPFSVALAPRPPKAPQNVTVGPLWTSNGSLNTELRWSPPPSDLPIQKYKVFWSRRLYGATALDSVLVHQQVVPKDQRHFYLHDLKPNSLYFLQVQALVQFGKERLKGEKSGLVLNTTNYTNITDDVVSVDLSSNNRIEDLQLRKLFWLQGDLRARLTWKARKHSSRYTISWWTGPCYQDDNVYNHFKLAATTKVSHFDLYDLQFNCRYRVSVRQVNQEGMKSLHDTSITFRTPSCEEFRKNNTKVKCSNSI